MRPLCRCMICICPTLLAACVWLSRMLIKRLRRVTAAFWYLYHALKVARIARDEQVLSDHRSLK